MSLRTITGCENGKEGLAAVLKVMPDLVISDIMMPEMDGTTLCSKIKTNNATNHIPVVLLTAKSREEDQLEGLETGADAYIVKPFNMDILRRTIGNLIHSHHTLQLKFGRNDQLEELVDDIKMKSPDEKLLERVMTAINQNLNNAELSVDKIADEVGISRVHLHRKMKELTGQTPHDPQYPHEESRQPAGLRRHERLRGDVCLRLQQCRLFLHRLQEDVRHVAPRIHE